MLKQNKVNVDYFDPFVPILKKSRNSSLKMKSKILIKSLLKYDCTVLLTDHDDLNYNLIKNILKLL